MAEVSAQCGLAPGELERWECGHDSPPCVVFLRIVNFYGEDAYDRAMELDWALQIEAARYSQ